MFALALRTIKDRKIFIPAYLIAGVSLMWMYVAIFPSIKEKSASYQQLVQGFPKELVEIFGIRSLDLTALENFLAIEQFPLMWAIIALFMLVALGGAALAGGIENGTIELLLSRPISRAGIFFGKYITGMTALLLFAGASLFSVVPLADLHGVEYSLPAFWNLFVLASLFGWAAFSMAMMFSAVFSERGRAYIATGGIVVAMYIANIIAVLFDRVEWVKYLSFFYYFDHNAALIESEMPLLSVAVFAAAIAAFTVAGAVRFIKRDITI